MPMDGRYSAMSQEGGAVMPMDGRYSAMSQEGGAVMPMDGRYSAMSQEGLWRSNPKQFNNIRREEHKCQYQSHISRLL